MKISAADLLVIVDSIRHTLKISNFSGCFSQETRQHTMNKIIDIMANIEVEVVTDKPNPETITADSGYV